MTYQIAPKIITHLVVAGLSQDIQNLPPERLGLVLNDVRNLVEGNIVSGEIDELRAHFSIAIVTHSMQQAARVSQRTAHFHLGNLIEIGDHAKNIAEYVVFLVKGRDVRQVASDRIEAESL